MTLQRTESTNRALLTKESLEQSAEQLDLLEAYVRDRLRKDEDYGPIPGTPKYKDKDGKEHERMVLLKPGAANLAAAFNSHMEITKTEEVLDQGRGPHGFVAYRTSISIISNLTGNTVATGQGACNSYEAKYRYRNAKPICPACGKETIYKSKFEPGFYCFAKVGGCGAKFAPDNTEITSQPIGRVENENPFDQANTIMKMAQKRAEVDAALRLPGVARFFTQDLDDDAPPAQNAPQPAAQPPTDTRKAAEAPSAKPQAQGEGPKNVGEALTAWTKRYGWKVVDWARLSRLAGKIVKTPAAIEAVGYEWLNDALLNEDEEIKQRHPEAEGNPAFDAMGKHDGQESREPF